MGSTPPTNVLKSKHKYISKDSDAKKHVMYPKLNALMAKKAFVFHVCHIISIIFNMTSIEPHVQVMRSVFKKGVIYFFVVFNTIKIKRKRNVTNKTKLIIVTL